MEIDHYTELKSKMCTDKLSDTSVVVLWQKEVVMLNSWDSLVTVVQYFSFSPSHLEADDIASAVTMEFSK